MWGLHDELLCGAQSLGKSRLVKWMEKIWEDSSWALKQELFEKRKQQQPQQQQNPNYIV